MYDSIGTVSGRNLYMDLGQRSDSNLCYSHLDKTQSHNQELKANSAGKLNDAKSENNVTSGCTEPTATGYNALVTTGYIEPKSTGSSRNTAFGYSESDHGASEYNEGYLRLKVISEEGVATRSSETIVQDI